MAKCKWNIQNRLLVFNTLLEKFGKHSEWGKQDYPDGKKGEYIQALEILAQQLSTNTGENFTWQAVRQQVRWGTTNQVKFKDVACARNYVLNKAIAVELGFVSYNTLCAIAEG